MNTINIVAIGSTQHPNSITTIVWAWPLFVSLLLNLYFHRYCWRLLFFIVCVCCLCLGLCIWCHSRCIFENSFIPHCSVYRYNIQSRLGLSMIFRSLFYPEFLILAPHVSSLSLFVWIFFSLRIERNSTRMLPEALNKTAQHSNSITCRFTWHNGSCTENCFVRYSVHQHFPLFPQFMRRKLTFAVAHKHTKKTVECLKAGCQQLPRWVKSRNSAKMPDYKVRSNSRRIAF